MNAYVDSSVLIRLLYGQANPLSSWATITRAISSELVRVDSLRTIDRTSIRAKLPAEQVAEHRWAALDLLSRLTLAPLTPSILNRASEPFPTPLGTLDAIHLATALEAANELQPLVLVTHDEDLAMAARAMGLDVAGA